MLLIPLLTRLQLRDNRLPTERQVRGYGVTGSSLYCGAHTFIARMTVCFQSCHFFQTFMAQIYRLLVADLDPFEQGGIYTLT